MAFTKTQKELKLAVLSVHFKIGLKSQVLKNQKNLQFPALRHFPV